VKGPDGEIQPGWRVRPEDLRVESDHRAGEAGGHAKENGASTRDGGRGATTGWRRIRPGEYTITIKTSRSTTTHKIVALEQPVTPVRIAVK
jgi:hypothetical protein